MQFRHMHFPRLELSRYLNEPNRFAGSLIAALTALALSLGAIVFL